MKTKGVGDMEYVIKFGTIIENLHKMKEMVESDPVLAKRVPYIMKDLASAHYEWAKLLIKKRLFGVDPNPSSVLHHYIRAGNLYLEILDKETAKKLFSEAFDYIHTYYPHTIPSFLESAVSDLASGLTKSGLGKLATDLSELLEKG